MSRCGPASVTAVKEGSVALDFDTGFIFTEVQGTIVQWVCDSKNNVTRPRKINIDAIGKLIATKPLKKGGDCRITDAYKYPDGKSIPL